MVLLMSNFPTQDYNVIKKTLVKKKKFCIRLSILRFMSGYTNSP